MPAPQVHTLNVQGMTCEHCVKTITEALQARDPAADVKVKLAGGEVRVSSSLTSDALIVAIAEAGYGAGLA
jgi:copper chaperone